MKKILIPLLILLPMAVGAIGLTNTKVDLGTIQRGHSYSWTYGIYNTSDVTECYVTKIFNLKYPDYQTSGDWITLDKDEFCLEPKTGEIVTATLKVTGRASGSYKDVIGACTYSGNVGACVGQVVLFEIKPRWYERLLKLRNKITRRNNYVE